MLANPVLPSQIEVSVGNNFFEMFFPYHFTHDLSELFGLFKSRINEEAQAKMNQFGFGDIQGTLQFVDSAYVLDQLQGSYQATGFEVQETDDYDELGVAKM